MLMFETLKIVFKLLPYGYIELSSRAEWKIQKPFCFCLKSKAKQKLVTRNNNNNHNNKREKQKQTPFGVSCSSFSVLCRPTK